MPFNFDAQTKRPIIAIFVWLCVVAILISIASPTLALDPSSGPRLIESDDPFVQQQGSWTTQASKLSSGGRYLYSSGSPDDVLTLTFTGTYLEILYVEAPQLGILAIEVDGVVLRSVMTQANSTNYQRPAVIDYLSDEPHTLRVYASQGVIGVDAFIATPTDTPSDSGIAEGSLSPRVSLCGSDDPTHRISIASDGSQGNGISGYMGGLGFLEIAVSDDGRYVAFASLASNLVSGDTNNNADIFVRDRQTCTTTRVSVASDGTQGNFGSYDPVMSGDGRYVLFWSNASNLVSGDTNLYYDAFVHDRITGTTERISIGDGEQESTTGSVGTGLSADGRYAAFLSGSTNLVPNDTNNSGDVFVRDRTNGTTERVSVATGGGQSNFLSYVPTLSADGRYVTFSSLASNLVVGDTNSVADVFVYDRNTGTTTRVSVATGGGQANGESAHDEISADGRYVVFRSDANNLVAGDTNGQADIFVRDLVAGTTIRVSVASNGTQGNGYSARPRISANGRYVTFRSNSTNLVSNITTSDNVFVHDLITGSTILASVGLDSGLARAGSIEYFDISGDGRFVAFESSASDLVQGDTNAFPDVFVRDLQAPFIAPFAPSNLVASTITQVQVGLTWTDNSLSESTYFIERSLDGATDWVNVAYRTANTTSHEDTATTNCSTTYYYRVRAYRASDGLTSTPSNVVSATTLPCFPPGSDRMALARASDNTLYLSNTFNDPAPANSSGSFIAHPPAPAVNGQWLMGDWNGDGHDSPGIYATNGVFYYTNTIGTNAVWYEIWIGFLGRPPVAGRFNAAVNHDCIGVVDSAQFPPYGMAFALYFACDMTNGNAPTLTFQWLSVLLPDSQGHSGAFQFTAGDFDGNGLDSIAVRRSTYIAWTNVPPTTLLSEFSYAQYIGAPSNTDYGLVVAGDWDQDGLDSFGLYYQTGVLYRRNDLTWNSGVGITLALGTPLGTPTTAMSWR